MTTWKVLMRTNTSGLPSARNAEYALVCSTCVTPKNASISSTEMASFHFGPSTSMITNGAVAASPATAGTARMAITPIAAMYCRPSAGLSSASREYAGSSARLIGATNSVLGMLASCAAILNVPNVCGPEVRPRMKSAGRSRKNASRFEAIIHFEKCMRSRIAASDSRGRSGCAM